MPSEELTTRALTLDDQDLYLVDDQVGDVSSEEFSYPESPVDIDEPASSSDSFTLSDAWASFRKKTESLAERGHRHAVAVYTDAKTYWDTHSASEIASDAVYAALKTNPATAPAVAAYEAAKSPAVREAAGEIMAKALPYAVPLYEGAKELAKEYLPKPVQKVLNSAEESAIAFYRDHQETFNPYAEAIGGKELAALLSGQPQIPATESVTEVAAVEKTIEATEIPQPTATPVSAPIAGEEWIDPWGYGDDYGIADAEEEIVETETVAVAEEDVVSSVVTAPVEETVVVAQTETAQAEVEKEEAVAVTEEPKKEENKSSKTVAAVQAAGEQTDVVSVDEDEGFAVTVEYAPELSTGAGATAMAGQAASASLSTCATETATKLRQKINLPAATGETVAVADQGEASEQNGVAEKVSIGRVSVEEKQEVEVAVAGVTAEKSSSRQVPSSVAGVGGLTSDERVAEFDARDGVEDARFVQGSSPGTVAHKDSSTTDSELDTVAANLSAPLNDVPGSSDKGFGSGDEGRDRSTENIHFYSDAADSVVEEEIADADVIESSIFPSDVVV